jgi:Tfp pilus assembly protein PilF
MNNSPAFILYVGKVLLPFNLSVMPNLRDQSLFLGMMSTLALVAAFFIRRPSSIREISWGVGWFFVFLAPTFVSATIFHEHRAYCSLIGLLFAVGQLPLIQSIDFSKNSRILGFVAILTVYGVIAMLHSEHFRNRTAYAMGAYLDDPGVDASHAALADLFLDEGNNDEAERVLRAAIARDSSMRFVHRLLGDVYANGHEYALAAREYETSIRIDEFEPYAYIGYGKICIEEGQPYEALRLWKRTVALNPNFLVGYQYLATFYTYVRNNPDSAMIYVKQVQQRGGSVVPELLDAIQKNSKFGQRNN